MAPNDGDLKEILKKILMHTKHYFRCWILVGAAIAVFLFVTSPAGAQWVNYPTAGIPRTADGKPNLAGPVPRTADGKPDFSGVWQPDDQKFFQNLAAGLKPEDVPMQARAKDLQQLRVAPKAYTKPWTSTTQKFHLVLNTDILEFICIEGEKDLPHLIAK